MPRVSSNGALLELVNWNWAFQQGILWGFFGSPFMSRNISSCVIIQLSHWPLYFVSIGLNLHETWGNRFWNLAEGWRVFPLNEFSRFTAIMKWPSSSMSIGLNFPKLKKVCFEYSRRSGVRDIFSLLFEKMTTTIWPEWVEIGKNTKINISYPNSHSFLHIK